MFIDINSGEKFKPSAIELIDYDDDEVEAKLIWRKDLFDNSKRDGYRLRLEFDNQMYDKNNLHYEISKELLVEYLDQNL